MPVTQKQIAQKLNVSVMTVSKALKGHPDISAKMRERVEKTAAEMNYTVNVQARNLAQKRTQTIGVVFPDISEPFYAEILRGIESVCRKQYYNILLADSDNDPRLEEKALQTLTEKRVDGLIIAPTEKDQEYIAWLSRLTIPYILINCYSARLACDSIYVDRGYGAFLSVTHLLKKGCQEVYFFYTFPHMEQSQASIQGCIKAFEELKKPRSHLHLIECPQRDLELFYLMTKEQLHFTGRKIGLFIWDDEMAIGCCRAIHELHLSIPDQVAIIGFDDIKITPYLHPALTTIHYPKVEMGQSSAQRLIHRLTHPDDESVQKTALSLQLVEREST
ncbi:MAG: LacI family transcriptional regulator [Calditrichaeota bacterium]|nr:MAG: LacI family transcriptional regulator [Calditrichota bacterium]